MTKTTLLAIRCIVGGAVFAVAGVGMLAISDFRSIAWGPLIAGPGLVLVGIYILKRDRSR